MENLKPYGFSNYYVSQDLVLYRLCKDNKLKKVTYNKSKKGYQAYKDNAKSSSVIKQACIEQLFGKNPLPIHKGEWKKLFTGLANRNYDYYISEYGSIYKYPTLTSIGKYVGFSKHSDGYLKFNPGRKYRSHYIHRLVAKYFIGKIPKDYVVNHIGGDKENNHYSNLEIIPHAENVSHAWLIGTQKTKQKRNKKGNSYKLITDKDIKEISFKRKFKVYTVKVLAKEYNCSIGYMNTILSRLDKLSLDKEKEEISELMDMYL